MPVSGHIRERYGEDLISLALGILEKRQVPHAVFAKHQLLTPRNVDLIYPLDRPSAPLPSTDTGLLGGVSLAMEQTALRGSRALQY